MLEDNERMSAHIVELQAELAAGAAAAPHDRPRRPSRRVSFTDPQLAEEEGATPGSSGGDVGDPHGRRMLLEVLQAEEARKRAARAAGEELAGLPSDDPRQAAAVPPQIASVAAQIERLERQLGALKQGAGRADAGRAAGVAGAEGRDEELGPLAQRALAENERLEEQAEALQGQLVLSRDELGAAVAANGALGECWGGRVKGSFCHLLCA